MPRKTAWQKEIEADANPILYHGANKSQLAVMFGLDIRTVGGKLSVLPPSGKIGVTDVWLVKEAAPYLVKPSAQKIEETIRSMSTDALPAHLRKEYWSAKRQEQAYLRDEGDLLHTTEVIGHYAETFKELRTQLLLLGEGVERQMELPQRARELLSAMIDSCMNDMQERLVTRFEDYEPSMPPPVASDDEWDVPVPAEEEEDEFHGL